MPTRSQSRTRRTFRKLTSWFAYQYRVSRRPVITIEGVRIRLGRHMSPRVMRALTKGGYEREELRLIKRFRPRFNVAMKRDGRNYCFIKITKRPAPKLVVVRGPGHDDSSIYYGPFMGAMGVSEAVREHTER